MVIYKLPTKKNQTDTKQSRELEGFWSGFLTMDHIPIVNQAIVTRNQYKITFVFIYYEKTFDPATVAVYWLRFGNRVQGKSSIDILKIEIKIQETAPHHRNCLHSKHKLKKLDLKIKGCKVINECHNYPRHEAMEHCSFYESGVEFLMTTEELNKEGLQDEAKMNKRTLMFNNHVRVEQVIITEEALTTFSGDVYFGQLMQPLLVNYR